MIIFNRIFFQTDRCWYSSTSFFGILLTSFIEFQKKPPPLVYHKLQRKTDGPSYNKQIIRFEGTCWVPDKHTILVEWHDLKPRRKQLLLISAPAQNLWCTCKDASCKPFGGERTEVAMLELFNYNLKTWQLKNSVYTGTEKLKTRIKASHYMLHLQAARL